MMSDYDVIVIGSGAGLNIARNAASGGYKTAFIEKDRLGGTCLNRGCIPSKMFIYPAVTADSIRDVQKLDIRMAVEPVIDFTALTNRVNDYTFQVSEDLKKDILLTKNLDFYHGRASFVSDREIVINGQTISGRKIFIGSGARPAIPDIDGLADSGYMTSTDALTRRSLPASMVVLGAGYIAAELGYAYSAFGCQVDFVVRSRFLRQEDDEVSALFQKRFCENHSVHLGWTVTRVSKKNNLFNLNCDGPDGRNMTLTSEALLIATGVVPDTDTLGLENTAVTRSREGYIRVNSHLETAVPGVYAFGDAVGNYLYRHTANYEAKYLVQQHFLHVPDKSIDYGPVPHAVFSSPEIAAVGLTEQEAMAAGMEFVKGTAEYRNSAPGKARGISHGMVKLLFNKKKRTLIGAHIIGDEAATMIHLFIVCMKLNGTIDDLLDTIFIHPALAEVAKEAVLDARNRFNTEPA